MICARGWAAGHYHVVPAIDDVLSPHKLAPEACAVFEFLPDTDATELAMWLFVARHVAVDEE